MGNSTESVASSWEILLVLPNGATEEVDVLGTFGTLAGAQEDAAMLKRLLAGDDRAPSVLMWVHCDRKHKDAKELLALPRSFYRRGISPRHVAVKVEPYSSVRYVPPVSALVAGDETDPDDTPLEVKDVVYSNCLGQ